MRGIFPTVMISAYKNSFKISDNYLNIYINIILKYPIILQQGDKYIKKVIHWK